MSVAGFIGSPSISFLEGTTITNSAPCFETGGLSIDLTRYEFSQPAGERAVSLGVRPEHAVTGEAAASQPFNVTLKVEVVEPMGSDTLVWSRLGGQEFGIRVDGQTTFRTGQEILAGFDPARASIFDMKMEMRI